MNFKKKILLLAITILIFSSVGCTVTIGTPPTPSDNIAKSKEDDKDNKKDKLDEPNPKKDDSNTNSATNEPSSDNNTLENENLSVKLADGWSIADKSTPRRIRLTNTKAHLTISSSLNNAKNKAYIFTCETKNKHYSEPKETNINDRKGYYCEDTNKNIALFLDYDDNCVIYELSNSTFEDKSVLEQIKNITYNKPSPNDDQHYTIENNTYKSEYFDSSCTIKLCKDWLFDLDNVSDFSATLMYPKEKLSLEVSNSAFKADENVQRHKKRKSRR